MTMFVMRSQIAPFLEEVWLAEWPALIRIDEGPIVVPPPRDWNLPIRDPKYVRLQGVLINGHHEWIYIPVSRAHEVHLLRETVTLEAIPLTEFLP